MAEENIYALKYRPRSWKEVVGHESVVRSFRQVIEKQSNRMFLLSGPSGVGKTTMARIGSKQAGCEESDIREYAAAVFSGVDDARQMAKSLYFRPVGSGKATAIILDECHRLSKGAWDALLKALEEPPAWQWWFLCTTEMAAVPAAAQTRCVKYNLKLVAKAQLRELLVEIAEAEKLELGSNEDDHDVILDLCVRNALGSPRGAVVNLAACIAAKNADDARELLFSVSEGDSKAFDLAKALAGQSTWPMVLEILSDLRAENPEGIRKVVQAFFTTMVLSGKNIKMVKRNLAVLEAFGQPFNSSDGITPVVLACGSLFHS